MTENPIDVLDDLADHVADEFEAYRQPDEFKDVSLVIENSDAEYPTLIVYVDRKDADSLSLDSGLFLQSVPLLSRVLPRVTVLIELGMEFGAVTVGISLGVVYGVYRFIGAVKMGVPSMLH